jgi:hypothetical protein
MKGDKVGMERWDDEICYCILVIEEMGTLAHGSERRQRGRRSVGAPISGGMIIRPVEDVTATRIGTCPCPPIHSSPCGGVPRFEKMITTVTTVYHCHYTGHPSRIPRHTHHLVTLRTRNGSSRDRPPWSTPPRKVHGRTTTAARKGLLRPCRPDPRQHSRPTQP